MSLYPEAFETQSALNFPLYKQNAVQLFPIFILLYPVILSKKCIFMSQYPEVREALSALHFPIPVVLPR